MLRTLCFVVFSLSLLASLSGCADPAAATAAGDAAATASGDAVAAAADAGDTLNSDGTPTDSAVPTTGACNSIAIAAPSVSATKGVAAAGTLMPTPEGGTLVDGTYFLTAHESFGVDPKPMTYKTVLVFAGGKLELAQIRNNGAEERANFAVTVTKTSFSALSTCPSTGQSLAYDSYTATPTQIRLFDDERVVTLTRQ